MKDEILFEIAKKHFGIETMKTRRSDSLDFHDVPIWSIVGALRDAYEAGKKSK